MQGLRTPENDRFCTFFDIVQKEAAKQGAVFFLDCGEGKDFETENMEGEDLSGWLIPDDKVSQFEPMFLNNENLHGWKDFLRLCCWHMNDGDMLIEFDIF